MACVAHEIGHSTLSVGSGAFSAPVIADRGDRAWVVVVHRTRPLAVGDRFDFAGSTWEIIRDRDLLRGFVARPVRRDFCTA
jgi:hypothetical protein